MAKPARRALRAALPEKDFQQQITELAKLTGWLVHAERPATNRSGAWSTPIQGDPGFPDLALAHPDGLLVVAELKTARGRLSASQERWLDTLDGAELHSYLWRPDSWPYIEQLLTGRLP